MNGLAAVRAWAGGTPRARDGWTVALFGLALRLAAVLWGHGRFPPAEDGHFYHVVAGRIADGHGYTWLWPDGAVTYAAHYPVGYPALIGGLYAIFGQHAALAMAFNAVLGAAAVWAVHRCAARVASRGAALLAALLAALHPTLVFYTPALMTEGVSSALVALAMLLVLDARAQAGPKRWRRLIGLGLLLGVATLIRPQLLLLAPVFGAWVVPLRAGERRSWVMSGAAGALTAALAIAVCLPWTMRNCARMERCVFVSANGGWNLLIGAGPGATGSWVPIEQAGMPERCRHVYAEAAKDACFGQAAVERIREQPGAWLALVPKKLSATFDYVGAAAWYLRSSNPSAWSEERKLGLGVAETAWQRVSLLLALLAAARLSGPGRPVRLLLGLAAALALFQPAAWPSYLALCAIVLLGSWAEPLAVLAGWTVFTTALTHAAFFGAGRYAVVCFTATAALAGLLGRGRAARSAAGALTAAK